MTILYQIQYSEYNAFAVKAFEVISSKKLIGIASYFNDPYVCAIRQPHIDPVSDGIRHGIRLAISWQILSEFKRNGISNSHKYFQSLRWGIWNQQFFGWKKKNENGNDSIK